MPANRTSLQLIEALVLAAPEPIGERRLAELVEDVALAEVAAAIEELNRDYERSGRAFRIVRGGGGYRFATLPQFGRWVRRLVFGSGRARLSRPALETVSIIAYRQPISRAEAEAIRGVDVMGVLKLLLERKLIRVQGRGPGPGRPLLYATTNNFLRYFGIDSLDDLPRPGELGADIAMEPETSSEGAEPSACETRDSEPGGENSSELLGGADKNAGDNVNGD